MKALYDIVVRNDIISHIVTVQMITGE